MPGREFLRETYHRSRRRVSRHARDPLDTDRGEQHDRSQTRCLSRHAAADAAGARRGRGIQLLHRFSEGRDDRDGGESPRITLSVRQQAIWLAETRLRNGAPGSAGCSTQYEVINEEVTTMKRFKKHRLLM